jgi:predicted lysophospholipase L1 biosynthesis ABC-type transport system permease subunit
MDDNQLTAGSWWSRRTGKPLVSISSEYQETLNLKLGDNLPSMWPERRSP